jgi:hypothetical protein
MLCEYNSLTIAHNPMSNRVPNPITKAHITSRLTANPVGFQQLDNPRAHVVSSDQISIAVPASIAPTYVLRLRLISVASRMIKHFSKIDQCRNVSTDIPVDIERFRERPPVSDSL